MSALAALLSLVAAADAGAGHPDRALQRRLGAEHVAHLRCRGDSARADGFLRTTAPAPRAGARARSPPSWRTGPSSTRICTQIYGGPQRARITGTIGARHIDRRLKRTNGCEIGDWQHAVPLVPRARAGVAQ